MDQSGIETVTRFIPIVSIATIIFGVLSLSAFYSVYHVNILSYLEINEVIFQTLKDFLLVAAIGIVVIIVNAKNSDPVRLSKLGVMYAQKTTYLAVRVSVPQRTRIIIMMIMILGLSIGFLGVHIKAFGKFEFYIISSTFMFIPAMYLLYIEINRRYYAIHKKLINNGIKEIIIFLIVLVTFAFFRSSYKSLKLKTNDDYLKNSIVVNNKLVKSSLSYYYIGKTNSYVFFYNERSNSTDIYPMSAISKLTLKE